MELDDRKVTILKAIIKTYLETGEPVGSRTISKYTDLKLSSPTIRNEMSDLEEMGYIQQPHTSAGRIPSDKGYRFYVDQIMQEKEQEVTEVKSLMIKRVDRVELVLKKLAQLLANNTNYAAMISGSPVPSEQAEIHPAVPDGGEQTPGGHRGGGKPHQECHGERTGAGKPGRYPELKHFV